MMPQHKKYNIRVATVLVLNQNTINNNTNIHEPVHNTMLDFLVLSRYPLSYRLFVNSTTQWILLIM